MISEYSNSGFKYHHAEGDTATLLLWLPNTACTVPSYATHHVGVGAAVLDEHNDKILVVKEKHKLVNWKLPGLQ